MKQSRSLVSILVIIALILLVAGLAWANYRFAALKASGGGFTIQWMAIRSLLTTGSSPYSNSTTAEIQASVSQDIGFAPGNSPRYTSPLFSGLVTFPFALSRNYALAHSIWLTVQLIVIFVIVIFCIRLTGWQPAWFVFLLFLLFTLFSYHIVIPWMDGSLAIWAALFLVAALLALHQDRNELAGILLALSFLQPQMVILVLIFTLIWSAAHRRGVVIFWFFATLFLLSIIGVLLVPDWITQYLRILYSYPQNFPPGTPGVLFRNTLPGLGKQLGWLLSGISAIVLLIEWWLARKRDFRWFIWTASLTMVISQWIGIPAIPGNFIALVIPLILISALFIERWPRGGQWVAVLTSVILFIWEWYLYYHDVTSSQPAMQLNLLFPMPLVLLIGLYWVRWWAIKPRRMLIEELKLGEAY